MTDVGLRIVIVAGCLMSLWQIGCSRQAPPVAELPPPEVTVARPVEREFPEYMEFSGRSEAVERVEVRARVSGYLEKVDFTEGEEVQENDVLFQIDRRPFQASLDAATAQVDQHKARQAKFAADITRIRNLKEKGAATQEQLDTALAEEAEARAAIEGAVAAARQATLDLEFTSVTAPITGRISRTNITRGNLVSPSTQLGGQPLTTIVSVDPMFVYFNVDEPAMLRAQAMAREKNPDYRPETIEELKLPVLIGLVSEKGFPHEGVLDFVDNQVDPDTGTIRLRAKFDNKNRLLTPGMFVRVQLPFGDPRPRLLVPELAIGTDQGQKYLMVVNDKQQAEYRRVELGPQTPDGLRAIVSGITAQDNVIVNGLQRVRPGMTVNASEAPPETATTARTEPKS